MTQKLKYIVVGLVNEIVHYSYTKQKAKDWIKKFGDEKIHHIEKISPIERKC